jgi:ketosteroid isomerase-like protein
MSKENVEIVRKAGENFNQGDFNAFMELFDDDVVLRMAEGWPERVYFGKAAARSFFDGWVDTVGQEVVVEELIDAGNAVVMRQRMHLSGVQSRIEGDQQSTSVWTLREGKAVMLEFFWDHQEALEAAGLRE